MTKQTTIVVIGTLRVKGYEIPQCNGVIAKSGFVIWVISLFLDMGFGILAPPPATYSNPIQTLNIFLRETVVSL